MGIQASGEKSFIGALIGGDGLLKPKTQDAETPKMNQSAWLEKERDIDNSKVSLFANRIQGGAYMP